MASCAKNRPTWTACVAALHLQNAAFMPGSAMTTVRDSPVRSLRYRQAMTVALLFGGYGALYFCRADLSVSTPLLIDELHKQDMSHGDAVIRMGAITSFGVLAYALGKLFLGGLGDFWGGRVSFLIGLSGATVFTLLFATGSFLPVFTIAWIGNRLTQSVAWAGLIKVSSKWFDFSSYGTIIGILSVSYLVGDAAARQWMGHLIQRGVGWRPLFYLAAGVSMRATVKRKPIPSTCSPPRSRGPAAYATYCCRCCVAALSCWFACCRWAAR
jgi:OPA family glycerol-3-phosphate transporter-like MFS transporter